jgi:hypothetical protein
VTLADTINLTAASIGVCLGSWLILVGLVGLTLGKFEPLRVRIGEELFIRWAVAMILVGLILFMAAAAASARLIV